MPESQEVAVPMARALELAPDDPGVQHAYAAVLGNLGRSVDAMRAWERSIELNPNNAAARAGLGITQIFRKRHIDAVANIDIALRLSPSDPLLYHWLAHRALASTMLPEAVHLSASGAGLATLAGFLSAVAFKLLE
jgi:Flp pilus assembly protein TadD